jgi:hypothetical protein
MVADRNMSSQKQFVPDGRNLVAAGIIDGYILVQISSAVLNATGKKKAESL